MEELSVHVKIAGVRYTLRVEPEEEPLARDAARQIQEKMRLYKAMNASDQQALVMVAFHCMTTKISVERQLQRLQQMVFDKITQLDQVVTTQKSDDHPVIMT